MGYKNLDVYRDSYELAKEIYQVTLTFPDFEKYDLASQLRRSSRAIPVNIAEGYGRKRYTNDFIKFLINSLSSTDEVKVHLDFTIDFQYISEEQHRYFTQQYEVIGRKLHNLIKSLEK